MYNGIRTKFSMPSLYSISSHLIIRMRKKILLGSKHPSSSKLSSIIHTSEINAITTNNFTMNKKPAIKW